MRKTTEIAVEIEKLKEELADVKGTNTEVYTRIVGYYRPVQNWNSGKKEEYGERVEFSVEKDEKAEEQESCSEVEDDSKSKDESFNIIVNDKGEIKKYKLFYSDNCPGCPPVKNYLKQISFSGEEINAGTKEGLEEAIKNNITGTPTVLFLNDAGDVITKAHTPLQIEQAIAV